jgi:uncharacterized protein (TIGR02145 family)
MGKAVKIYCVIFISILLFLQSCEKDVVNQPVIIETGSVTDIDGNTYRTVKIGNQWWMAENLKVKHYNNGEAILNTSIIASDSAWEACLIGSYCFYSDSLLGCLYNHMALEDSRKIAPEGWHIPSDEEWKTLELHIGMSLQNTNEFAWRGTNEGEKLMNKALVGWPQSSIAFGSDLYGFSALAGGCRLHNGFLNQEKNTAFFWASNVISNKAFYRSLDAQKKNVFRQKTYRTYGMSVRCVKD